MYSWFGAEILLNAITLRLLGAVLIYWILLRLTARFSRSARLKLIGAFVAVHLLWWVGMHSFIARSLRYENARGGFILVPDNDPKWKQAVQYYVHKQKEPVCPGKIESLSPVPFVLFTSEMSYFPTYTQNNRIVCNLMEQKENVYLLTSSTTLKDRIN